MHAGARMATPRSWDHLLIVNDCIQWAPVQIPAAVATFTRSLEFNPILEAASLIQLRNRMTGTLLYMTGVTILGQKLPLLVPQAIPVINAFHSVTVPH